MKNHRWKYLLLHWAAATAISLACFSLGVLAWGIAFVAYLVGTTVAYVDGYESGKRVRAEDVIERWRR